MSTNDVDNDRKRKGVRFAEAVPTQENTNGDEGHSMAKRPREQRLQQTSNLGEGQLPVTHKKRSRPDRPNEDELDDVDDWNPAEEGEDEAGVLLNEKTLINARRERRLKRTLQQQSAAGVASDDDEIDDIHAEENYNEKSLAAEGVEIEPFSMEQERTDGTGYFDGDTYVFRKEKEEPDAWLDSLDEIHAPPSINLREGGKNEEDDNDQSADENFDSWSEQDLYAKIFPLVSDTETVLQAIARYGNLIQHKRQKKIKGSAANDSGGISSDKDSEASKMAQAALNELTEAANALLLKGKVDIYQKTRNDLSKIISLEGKGDGDGGLSTEQTASHGGKDDAISNIQWEYQGSEDGQIHGPFSTEQMQGWIQQGYFVGASAVKVRTITTTDSTKTPPSMQDDLMADLMEDEADRPSNGSAAIQVHRGEWMMSDQVDFSNQGVPAIRP